MTSIVRKYALAAGLAASAAFAPAFGQEYKAGAIKVVAPWIRATPAGAKVAGGYMRIENAGQEADRLVGGSSSVGAKLELHEMSTAGGVMKMRELPKGLELKPGQTVELKPGSYHIMLTGLKQPLKQGDKVKGTLVFEKAGTVEIEYAVRPIGASGGQSGHGGQGGHGGHGKMGH